MSRMTSKGQVTIPKRVRDYLGLKPGSEVEFTISNNGQFIIRARKPKKPEKDRLEEALEALRGSAGPGMSTDEVMRLTRGWGEDDDLK
jgi:antitoxin PrlF